MSQLIHNPTLARIDEHTSTTATFVVEPLHNGYGVTLGNSLRRVLVSSIRGSAITAFRVEGITHEFTTIPGVKEDVVDIMLNLKSVCLYSQVDEPIEVTLEKKGTGVVTAGDIKVSADVEIIDKETVICTIDDPKASIRMHIIVESGHGYRTLEESSERRIHSDMIALDAFFSPVRRVRYNVESTRVGHLSNLDKLNLTVETDGSMSPKDAFEEAAAILVNQYTALAGSTRVEAAPSLVDVGEEVNSKLMMPIEEMNFSARTTNALINNDICTINDLVTLSEVDLKELKGFGSKAMDEVREALARMEF